VQVVRRVAHAKISNESQKFMISMKESGIDEKKENPSLLGQEKKSKQFFMNKVSAEDRDPMQPSSWGKIGRNENCPCGSAKKYKHCHGKI
jgi:uncharacterized protein YecA (UPF0149 family)